MFKNNTELIKVCEVYELSYFGVNAINRHPYSIATQDDGQNIASARQKKSAHSTVRSVTSFAALITIAPNSVTRSS